MEDGKVKFKVQEQCRNNGKLGHSMEEQAEDVGENDQHETQTRNSGVRTRMAMVVTIVITVATIVVFANGVIVGSLNGIRPDRMWIKHNLVDGLRTETMAGMSGLDKARTNQIALELELSGAGRN